MASSSSDDEQWITDTEKKLSNIEQWMTDTVQRITNIEQIERDTEEKLRDTEEKEKALEEHRRSLEEQRIILAILAKSYPESVRRREESIRRLKEIDRRLEEELRKIRVFTEKWKKTSDMAELGRYEMGESPRGICLLINNIHFSEEKERKGAELDEEEIEKLFREELHFEMAIKRNLDGVEISNAAREIAGKDHSKYTAFVFIIMSHGGRKDAILGLDGRKAYLEDLMSEFTAPNCPSLEGKPKLFFIQACRGNRKDRRRDRVSPSPNSIEDDSPDCNIPIADSTFAAGVSPREADFLLAFSTVPRYQAFRNKVEGSWFIQILVDVIRKHHHHHHLLDMLTEVTKQVAEIANECPDVDLSFQVPAPTHTLRAQVFL